MTDNTPLTLYLGHQWRRMFATLDAARAALAATQSSPEPEVDRA